MFFAIVSSFSKSTVSLATISRNNLEEETHLQKSSDLVQQLNSWKQKQEQQTARSLFSLQQHFPRLHAPPLHKNNKPSPYRFGATSQMLSYPDTNITARKNLNSTYVTSVHETLRYRDIHQRVIPLDEPIVYFITPTTHKSDTQLSDLTTLGQTLHLDGNIYWIVVEDAATCSPHIRLLLERMGLPFAHVHTKTKRPKGRKVPAHRGIDQRNKALEVIEGLTDNTSSHSMEGIVYFGDDDNTYDVHIFSELRKTRTVGVLPVGFTGGGCYERCIVHPVTGKVQSIATAYARARKFPIDMAGFCFHSNMLHQQQGANATKSPRFEWKAKAGTLETFFLEQIANSVSDLDPLADNCTKIYVWHTKSVSLESSDTNKKSIKPGLETYFDGIGEPPPTPVFPREMSDIAFRVGGVTVDIPRHLFDQETFEGVQNTVKG